MKWIKAELINYFDVWGNKKDGWEVNNLCSEGFIGLPENFTDKDIMQALKRKGFFKKTVRLNMLEIENQYPFYEIYHKSNGYKPICRLQFKD